MRGRGDRRLVAGCVAAALHVLGFTTGSAAQSLTFGPAEQAEFLQTARIVGGEPIGTGVTQPWRLTLSDGRVTHDAAFNTASEQLPLKRFDDGTFETNFVDAYRFNIAAYRLADLLGIGDIVPVTIERTWNARRGSLSWWIDGAFDEGERLRRGLSPPDPRAWNRQMYRVRVFANLVHDTDRNLGNMLIAEDWHVWMIDFTRAFRVWDRLPGEGDLRRIDRALLDRLRTITADEIAGRVESYLTESEIAALLARRDLIVSRFDRLVAEQGEAEVLY